jgi:hypothetical protein
MAELVYALCMLTSIAIAVLLLRGYAQSQARLLLWCALCFGALAINNGLLFLDKVVYPNTDLHFLGIALSVWRSSTALIGLGLLLWGMIWDVE